LIAQKQASEIIASHQKIISDGASVLWDKIKEEVYNVSQTCELHGVRIAVKDASEDSLTIYLSVPPPSIIASKAVHLNFNRQDYKFEVLDSNLRDRISEVCLGVSNGRMVLSQGSQQIPDVGTVGLAEIACERLLAPVLRPYV
jgi:hypothetical protein